MDVQPTIVRIKHGPRLYDLQDVWKHRLPSRTTVKTSSSVDLSDTRRRRAD